MDSGGQETYSVPHAAGNVTVIFSSSPLRHCDYHKMQPGDSIKGKAHLYSPPEHHLHVLLSFHFDPIQ